MVVARFCYINIYLIFPFPIEPWVSGVRCEQCAASAQWVRARVYLVEADDVGVLQQLHDLHLSEDLFQVLIVQLGLIHYFYSHLDGDGGRDKNEIRCQKERVRLRRKQFGKQGILNGEGRQNKKECILNHVLVLPL